MKNLQKEIQLLLNLYKLKNLTEASLLNKKLIDDYPNVVILYNIMGLILTEQNKIEEAIKCYKNGIKIEPTYAMIYNNLGSIYKSKASSITYILYCNCKFKKCFEQSYSFFTLFSYIFYVAINYLQLIKSKI